MKYLILIVLLALLFFVLGFKRARPRRPEAPPAPPAKPAAAPDAQPIVSCAHCGLHLPQAEALPGRGGLFCSAAHRAAHEASQDS
jgi:uncharacterized protein